MRHEVDLDRPRRSRSAARSPLDTTGRAASRRRGAGRPARGSRCWPPGTYSTRSSSSLANPPARRGSARSRRSGIQRFVVAPSTPERAPDGRARDRRPGRGGRRARPPGRSSKAMHAVVARRTRCASARPGRSPSPRGRSTASASSPRAERTAQRRMTPSSGRPACCPGSAAWTIVQPGRGGSRGARPRQSSGLAGLGRGRCRAPACRRAAPGPAPRARPPSSPTAARARRARRPRPASAAPASSATQAPATRACAGAARASGRGSTVVRLERRGRRVAAAGRGRRPPLERRRDRVDERRALPGRAAGSLARARSKTPSSAAGQLGPAPADRAAAARSCARRASRPRLAAGTRPCRSGTRTPSRRTRSGPTPGWRSAPRITSGAR